MPQPEPIGTFLLCVKERGIPRVAGSPQALTGIRDPVAESRGFVRVVDGSREDYLYAADCFVGIDLPQAARPDLRWPGA